MTSRRVSYLSGVALTLLSQACESVAEAFDSHPYLVGSAITDPDYRDVDVRVILDDGTFDALFAERPRLWELVCLTVGRHLALQSGLPVDFQIQRMTEANERFGDGQRHALGMRHRRHMGGGDATRFHDEDVA